MFGYWPLKWWDKRSPKGAGRMGEINAAEIWAQYITYFKCLSHVQCSEVLLLSSLFPFSCSRWSVHNPSWILGAKGTALLCLSLQSLSSGLASLLRDQMRALGVLVLRPGYATRFPSLKQSNISLASGSEQRQKPQNENRAGGSRPQILWPHSHWKSGVQQAPGLWLKQLGDLSECAKLWLEQAPGLLFETKVTVSPW